MDFETAIDHVLRFEGGYSDHPSDPGGITNYGITQRTAQAHGYMGSMKSIPMHIVRDIYRRSYWEAGKCDQLPADLRLMHFDCCVNSGVGRAAKWLQESVGATVDGIIGPKTLTAAHNADNALARYGSIRLAFLAELSTFTTFGRGWIRRVADILKTSAGRP